MGSGCPLRLRYARPPKRYTGRTRLDTATIDRYFKINFDYDNNLERAIALSINPKCDQWVDKVQGIRKAVANLKIDVLVSPRTTLGGAELLLLGMSEMDALKGFCFAGLDDSTINKIMQNAA